MTTTPPASPPEPDRLVQDLAMLIRQLCWKTSKLNQADMLVGRAMYFLRHHGLQGSPLREDAAPAPPPEISELRVWDHRMSDEELMRITSNTPASPPERESEPLGDHYCPRCKLHHADMRGNCRCTPPAPAAASRPEDTALIESLRRTHDVDCELYGDPEDHTTCCTCSWVERNEAATALAQKDAEIARLRTALLGATGAFEALKLIGADRHLPGFQATLDAVNAALAKDQP